MNRLRARMEALETTMESMVVTMKHIDQMYTTVKESHEVMMQEKSDAMRAGTLAEIQSTMDVLRRDLLQEVKRAIQVAMNSSSRT